MASTLIQHAVGAQGANKLADVKIVFELLGQVPFHQGGPQTPLAPPAMLTSSYARQANAVEAIRRFQKHHFGIATGTIEPNNITIGKLNAVVHGATPAGVPVTFDRAINQKLAEWYTALIPKIRDEIVKVASHEALRADGVKGIGNDGKQSEQAAARLREYFQVFSNVGALLPDSYYQGRPGGYRWCGIFAVWVVNEATRRSGASYNGTFVLAKSLNRADQPLAHNANGSLDGVNLKPLTTASYSKGDICLTKEQNVKEDWPTHHFIVAEDPADAIREGRAMQTIEGNFPLNGTGARHSVTLHRRPVLNYLYFDVFQPPAM